MLVTKDVLAAGSTQWAQGGIAAALGPGDTPRNTCATRSPPATGCATSSRPDAGHRRPGGGARLISLGAVFDLADDGELALTREGGHHRDRIAHAGGDATGAEIQRALVAALRAGARIEVIEHALALDLQLADDGGVAGITLHVMGEGQRDGVGACLPRGGARHRRHRPDLRRHHQPRGRHRRRWRSRCAPARCSATWSSCSSTRPCSGSAQII